MNVTQAIVAIANLVVVKLITVFMIMDGNGQQANQVVFVAALMIVLVMIQILIRNCSVIRSHVVVSQNHIVRTMASVMINTVVTQLLEQKL